MGILCKRFCIVGRIFFVYPKYGEYQTIYLSQNTSVERDVACSKLGCAQRHAKLPAERQSYRLQSPGAFSTHAVQAHTYFWFRCGG